jgi:electron transfer flavoprotein alpha subunit
VLADQKAGILQPTTLHAVTAAKALGGPVTVLVAGRNVGAAAQAASSVDGVDAVLAADDAALEHALAEPTAALLAEMQKQ